MSKQILDLVDGISRTPPREEGEGGMETNLENNSMQNTNLGSVIGEDDIPQNRGYQSSDLVMNGE